MQHKSVLFLISLSQNKIHEIEEKGVDYKLFMKTIRSYSHVEVHETITEELISTASLYEVVVIVGHQVDGCIEMRDGSLFPMAKIASALHQYTGYIHVAVCGSSVIRDAIKQGSPDSRLRTSKQSTQLELQLLIYSLLLSRTDLNKDTFDYWYEFEWNFIKEIQERKDPADLAKLPCATKLGEASSENVKTSVFFPEEVVRGEFYKLQIILHLDVDTGTLYFDIAKGNDPKTAERKNNVALKNVHTGDYLLLNLSFLDAENRLPTRQIIVQELEFEDDHFTKEITISDKDKTEIIICVKVTKDYHYGKFFTLLKFLKDYEVSSFEFDTYIKTEDIQDVSNDPERKEFNLNAGKPNYVGTPRFGFQKRIDQNEEYIKVLTSDTAKKYWEKLQISGFVDENYQLLEGTTRQQAMYIAEVFAEKLNCSKSKWKMFEMFWDKKNLAQEKWSMLDTGISPKRSKEIDEIFRD